MADFLNATKDQVFYKIGIHKGTNKARLIKAPFDLVNISGNTYVTTCGLNGDPAKEFSGLLDGTIAADSEAGYQNRLSDNGWIRDNIVVEPHEMGDIKDDNWKSLHAFGVL